jgi:hypothetical protein
VDDMLRQAAARSFPLHSEVGASRWRIVRPRASAEPGALFRPGGYRIGETVPATDRPFNRGFIPR